MKPLKIEVDESGLTPLNEARQSLDATLEKLKKGSLSKFHTDTYPDLENKLKSVVVKPTPFDSGMAYIKQTTDQGTQGSLS